MRELTDETINKREKGYDGYKHEPENLSGPTVDKFYSEDRQALRKWFEENHSTSTGAWMIYDKNFQGREH